MFSFGMEARARAHPPPPSIHHQTHPSSLTPSPSGAKQGGITGIGTLQPPLCRHYISACFNIYSNGKNREHNGGAGYREDGMGELTAFLLLLVATLTLSSEVSTTEKICGRVSVRRSLAPWLGCGPVAGYRGHQTRTTVPTTVLNLNDNIL